MKLHPLKGMQQNNKCSSSGPVYCAGRLPGNTRTGEQRGSSLETVSSIMSDTRAFFKKGLVHKIWPVANRCPRATGSTQIRVQSIQVFPVQRRLLQHSSAAARIEVFPVEGQEGELFADLADLQSPGNQRLLQAMKAHGKLLLLRCLWITHCELPLQW